MKKLFILLLLAPFFVMSQALSYADGAVLFSGEDNFGTARYMGMSGAFGALGGDMSAADINPAGLAIFNSTSFATTLSYQNVDNRSSFYGNGTDSSDDQFNFSQIGAVTIFNTHQSNGFKKFAVGFNYSLLRDFDNAFFVSGNSGIPDFVDDPFLNYDDDPLNDVFYTNVDKQEFRSYTSGANNRFSFSLASQYEDNLYLGLIVNTHQIDFFQRANYSEFNNDGRENLLDAYLDQSLDIYGTGFSFGLGAIFKPMESLRLGAAYKSPTWYNISERFIEDTEIYVTNNEDVYTDYGSPNYFDYSLNTPSEFTGSVAYIFGTMGLISFDYIYRDYQNIKLKPTGDFIEDNAFLSDNLRGTSSYRLGTEWIIKSFSLRGGYRFVQSPYKNSFVNEDLTGYSFGLGIKFSRTIRMDIAYDNFSNSYSYRFLNLQEVNPAVIDRDVYRISSALVVTF